MENKRICNLLQDDFPDFWNLYNKSFPFIERRDLKQQARALENSAFNLVSFYEEDKYLGFLAFWDFPSYIYLEHFAINENLRGGGYGTKILSELIEEKDKVIILEIDPIEDAQSRKRLSFYKKMGFVQNDFDYKVQSYQNKEEFYELIIISSVRKISKGELDIFRTDFINEIL